MYTFIYKLQLAICVHIYNLKVARDMCIYIWD